MSKNAFPTTEYYDEVPVGESPGMTLRDYFAAKAMQAIHQVNGFNISVDDTVRHAYTMADRMIMERDK